MTEIDEDGHPYFEKRWDKTKVDRKSWPFFIAINPDLDPDAGFDPDVGIEKLYNCINESSPTLAVTSAERSLKEKFAKVLLSYMSSITKPLNYNKYLIALPTL